MPDHWEARITRLTISDDQSQMHEPLFTQRVEFEPDLTAIIDAYGPSEHSTPPPPVQMVMRADGTYAMPGVPLPTGGPYKAR